MDEGERESQESRREEGRKKEGGLASVAQLWLLGRPAVSGRKNTLLLYADRGSLEAWIHAASEREAL